MPYVKLYIHLVFSTKNRIPFLKTPELREKVWKHIREMQKLKEYTLILSMVILIIATSYCL